MKHAVKRRLPTQERSQQKIELIFEAATRIIQKQGLSALTTNLIAEVSGVSVGTIYQYFSNKEEIIAQLGQRERQIVVGRVRDALQVPDGPAPVRVLAREILGAFKGRRRVHKELIDAALAIGRMEPDDKSFARISSVLTSGDSQVESRQLRPLNAAEVFVLTHAFMGAVRAYVRFGREEIDHAEAEDALVRLVEQFLSRSDS